MQCVAGSKSAQIWSDVSRLCVLWVSWCVAVCCNVLQCVAVCCSVLQCVAGYCSVLQCVAVCCRYERDRCVYIRHVTGMHMSASIKSCGWCTSFELYVCIYVSIHVCMCVFIQKCTYVCLYVCMCTHAHIQRCRYVSVSAGQQKRSKYIKRHLQKRPI